MGQGGISAGATNLLPVFRESAGSTMQTMFWLIIDSSSARGFPAWRESGDVREISCSREMDSWTFEILLT